MTISERLQEFSFKLGSSTFAQITTKEFLEKNRNLDLDKLVLEIVSLEKKVKDLNLQLSNLNLLSKLNPIISIILKSNWINEETKQKLVQLLDRIINSILQSTEFQD
jgi:galactitol-specific phosphotransferase system IIB component